MGKIFEQTEQLDLFSTSNTDYEEEQKEKKVESASKLTPRQWALYRLIYENSIQRQRKTSQREIYETLKDYGYECKIDPRYWFEDYNKTWWKDFEKAKKEMRRRYGRNIKLKEIKHGWWRLEDNE